MNCDNTMDENYDEPDLELTKEQINDISDIIQGFDMLEERNLFLNYVNNLDDIKEILTLKYHSECETIEVSKQNYLYQNYPNFMENLNTILIRMKKYVELPEFKREIGEIYKISESQIICKIDEMEKMIKQRKFPILTAGEAKAGKSTFINLLLGKDLLPMDIATSTRIICEIKNSEKNIVKFTAPGKEYIVKRSKEIAAVVKQGTPELYTKVIYKCPVKFLENYTCLVDIPGIGDNTLLETLETMTFDYLTNCAPAIIFVLNATNSNGLNLKARQFIEKARQCLSNEANKYISEINNLKQIQEYCCPYYKAIFILNHWDTVRENAKSKEEVEKVRQIIIAEIKLLWHDSVEENEQIFFISAKQANEWQKHQIVQKEILKIRNCIKKRVVNLYQKNIENSLELLHQILSNMEKKLLQIINTVVHNKYCKLNVLQNAEQLCRSLENIKKDMDNRKAKIREQLKPKFDTMTVLLTERLKSISVENKILENSLLCIKDFENMELLTIVFRKVLEKILYDEMNEWEKETKEIENLYSFLNGLFKTNLIEINNELKISHLIINKESLIKPWNSSNQKEVTNLDADLISKKEKVLILSTITLLFPVVVLAGLLATPLIMTHISNERKSNEERSAEFKRNPTAFLRRMISTNLQKLSINDVRRSFFIDVQRKCEDLIKGFEVFIITEIDEKRQLITEIEKETRAIPEILKSLSNLFYKIERIYGDYHNLRNEYSCSRDQCMIVRSSTYEMMFEADIKITECITTGRHSVVFKNKNYPNLVFKTYSKKFLKADARFQMQEINLLITAPADFILRCRHICILKDKENVLLVLDYVDCNLHTYLVENQHLIPSRYEKNTDLWRNALMFILDVAIKLCKGLEYLHKYEPWMVHPDLRLDTILVKKTNVSNKVNIYICDACSNLQNRRVHRVSGHETYEESFDMGGFTKENIYRLGEILYNLAYLEFGNICKRSKSSVVSMGNLFPNSESTDSMELDLPIKWDLEIHENIPSLYNQLIKNCLSKKPARRPTITECIESLQTLKRSISTS